MTCVNSLPVDDELRPFWNGVDATDRVARWASSARPEWGTFTNDPRGNGPSGQLLDERYLEIVDIDRGDAWITDCLDTYFGSAGQHAVVDFYQALSGGTGSLPTVNLAPHPDTTTIERLAVDHTGRLRSELTLCEPEEAVTLGAAALTVFPMLVDLPKSAPRRLTPSPSCYGRAAVAPHRGRTVR